MSEENIAEKSEGAALMLWLGALISVIFGILAWSRKEQGGWGWFLLFCVLFFLVMLFCAIHETRRPKILIRRAGNTLFVYTRGRRKTIAVSEIENVDFRESESGSIRLTCGTLKIFTKSETVRIYNVKCVRDVAMELVRIVATVPSSAEK